jgi:hypothetical protein
MSLSEADKKVLKAAKEYLLGNYDLTEINERLLRWVLAREIGANASDPARKKYLWGVLPPIMKKWLQELVAKKRKLEILRDAREHERMLMEGVND